MFLFAVLLFSGFAEKSIYHGILSIWAVILCVLIELKFHFKRKPSSISKRKFIYVLVIVSGIFVTIVMILFYNVPRLGLHEAKLILAIVAILVFFLVLMKLLLQWNKLTKAWRITLILGECYFAVLALINLIG